jgi:outer membrane protein assembly factor BamB
MRLLLAFVSPLLLTLPLLADDWPQFRGPNGTGVSKAKGLPTEWGEKTNVVWKTAIHDKGWSSPVVFGKQVWLTTARDDGKAQWAVCVDRGKGKVIHDIKVFDTPKVPYTFMKDYNSHASPSPAIEKGRVYVHFGSAGTACLDTATGKKLWERRDLKCDHFRAPGSSPVLYKDLVILTFDGFDKQYLVALYKKDGKTAWEKERTLDYPDNDNGDLKKAYSTPSLFEVGGKAQLVSPAAAGAVAYDPQTGKELWKVTHTGMNAATPPVMAAGKVFVTTGHTGLLLAIRPTGSGDVTKTHVDLNLKKGSSRPAPLALGELIFLVSDQGLASAIEAKTGKQVWKRQITGNYYSSPVCADGHLYAFDREGKGQVLTADREGKLVTTNRLDAGACATPAIAGKALYVRTYTHLYRIEKKD